MTKEKSSEFSLIGQFVDFVVEREQIKQIKIAILTEEYTIKLDKKLRNIWNKNLEPGIWLEIKGKQKHSLNKAKEIKIIEAKSTLPDKKTSCILICQKSTCWKNGGETVCQLLEENLRDRGLEEQVIIKTTGCLKQCSQAPNLVVMPDKTRYSNVQPKEIIKLIDRHLIQA